jgi:hypothetical protein
MDTIPPTPHEVATARSTEDFDWRNYVVTRIKIFKDRRVGSLSHGELEAVTPWMGRVKECWATLDREIKYHYIALKFARQAAGIQGVSLPVTEIPHLPELGPAPQRSFKVPPATLGKVIEAKSSGIGDSFTQELLPAQISRRPAHEQSVFASADVRDAERSFVDPSREAGSPAGVSSLALAGRQPDNRLAVFAHICEEIRRATTLPEALSIKAQTENMQLGALLNGDKEARRRYAAARLAAVQRIGELLGDLEKAPLGHDAMGRFSVSEKPSRTSFPSVGSRDGTDFSAVASQSEVKKSKSEILKENRISTSTANRYERLAGPPKPEIREAVHRASDQYFSERLKKGEMPKGGELLQVVETAGGLPQKPGLMPAQQRAYAFLRWLRKIGKEPDQYSGAGLADYAKPTDAQSIAELRKIVVEFDTRFKRRFPQPQPEVAS